MRGLEALEKSKNYIHKAHYIAIKKDLKNYEKIREVDSRATTINDFYDSDIKMVSEVLTMYENKMLESCKDKKERQRLLELFCFGQRFVKSIIKGYNYNKRDYNTHHEKELKALDIIRNSKFNNEHFVDNLISYLGIQRPKDKDLLKEVFKS